MHAIKEKDYKLKKIYDMNYVSLPKKSSFVHDMNKPGELFKCFISVFRVQDG